MDRKVCFILDAGNWEGWGQTPVQSSTPPTPDNQWARAFRDRGRGLHTETAQSALTVALKLVIGGLTIIILSVLSTVDLQFQVWFVSIPWGQFSELWQFMSWLQSGHHVVNFFHLVDVSVSAKQLTGYDSEYYL